MNCFVDALRDCLLSTLKRARQAFVPNYEYFLVNASTDNCGGNPQRQCLLLVGARGHITLLSAHPTLQFCYHPAREEECSIFTIKSVTCAVKCSIDNIVTASTLLEILFINVSFPQNYHFVVNQNCESSESNRSCLGHLSCHEGESSSCVDSLLTKVVLRIN